MLRSLPLRAHSPHRCGSGTRSLPVRHPLQVKLRGFRIELGEVEAAIVDTKDVQLAVALVLHDPAGAQRLVAYYAPDAVEPAAVLMGLRERLPAHMVPSALVPLERMPLLPNEKIDRRALPAPDWGAGGTEEYVGPANDAEARLQRVWQEVLGQERISMHEDFFAAGGNSLQARRPCPASVCSCQEAM